MIWEEAIARLSRYQTNEPSKWREQEEKRRRAKEEGWLQYSRRIANKIAMTMKQQTLTLETICKLETALNVSILQFEFV